MSSDLAQTRSDAWRSVLKNRLQDLRRVPDGPHLRDAVLAELDAANKVIAEIKTACNSRAPVMKLPNELLVQIFYILPDEWTPYSDYDGSYRKQRLELGWLNVTFVCSRWRSIALSAASLWTDNDLSLGSTWARLFFVRAECLPISLSGDEVDTLVSLSDVFETAPHPVIRSLGDLSVGQLLKSALPPPLLFGNLESMQVEYDDVADHGGEFWGHVSSDLRDLSLDGATNESHLLDPEEAVAGLALLLARSNVLEKLTIYGTFLWPLVLSVPTDLPALCVLAIAAASSDCLRLLRALGHPNNIQRLAIELGSWESADIHGIFEIIRHSSTSSPSDPFTSVGVGRADFFVTLAAARDSDSDTDIEDMFENDEPPLHYGIMDDLSLCFSMVDDPEDTYECLYAGMHCLDFAHVRTLRLHNVSPAVEDVLRHYRAMGAVEELRLVGAGLCTVLTALGVGIHRAQGAPGDASPVESVNLKYTSNVLFPLLRHLAVKYVDFDAQDPGGSDPPRSVGKALAYALALRAERGIGLERLFLTYCEVDEDDLADMSATVTPTLQGSDMSEE
ncbi:unnamed protein product [Peniophora sp. CBMAI 1063]|nr:unnamed protein product [Peniophora sp. CBMAI 1063]